MQVARWGNSLAVRIPVEIARTLGIKEGDEIQLCALSDDQVAVVTEHQRRAAAIARMNELARPLPEDYRFDREEANRR